MHIPVSHLIPIKFLTQGESRGSTGCSVTGTIPLSTQDPTVPTELSKTSNMEHIHFGGPCYLCAIHHPLVFTERPCPAKGTTWFLENAHGLHHAHLPAHPWASSGSPGSFPTLGTTWSNCLFILLLHFLSASQRPVVWGQATVCMHPFHRQCSLVGCS